jgi:hypothetical protein
MTDRAGTGGNVMAAAPARSIAAVPAAAITRVNGIPARAAIGALRRNRSLIAVQP